MVDDGGLEPLIQQRLDHRSPHGSGCRLTLPYVDVLQLVL